MILYQSGDEEMHEVIGEILVCLFLVPKGK